MKLKMANYKGSYFVVLNNDDVLPLKEKEFIAVARMVLNNGAAGIELDCGAIIGPKSVCYTYADGKIEEVVGIEEEGALDDSNLNELADKLAKGVKANQKPVEIVVDEKKSLAELEELAGSAELEELAGSAAPTAVKPKTTAKPKPAVKPKTK